MQAEEGSVSGKRQYSWADLESITNFQLADRLHRIDNPIAYRIADNLYTHCVLSGSMQWHSSLDPGYARLHGTSLATEVFEEVPVSLRQLVNRRPADFLRLLNRLRLFSFRELVAGGPEALRERLDQRPLLERLFTPEPRLKITEDIAPLITEQPECIVGIRTLVPQCAIRAIQPYFPVLFTFGPLAIVLLLGLRDSALLMLVLLPSMLALFYVEDRIKTNERHLRLALYITFTDEFVEEDGKAIANE